MPFIRPTMSELIDQSTQDVNGRLTGAAGTLRRSVLRVLVRVFAGAVSGLYGFLTWIARQILPDTAEGPILIRMASRSGLGLIAARAAIGTLRFAGTNGRPVPAGALIQRIDGAEFAVTADTAVVGGFATVAVSAVVAGVAGNTEPGVTLRLVSPIAGVTSDTVTGLDGLGGGRDEEKIEELRERFLDVLRDPPGPGNIADYRRWTRESIGSSREWVYPEAGGVGTVTVRYVIDSRANIFPLPADRAATLAYIEDNRRPVGAQVTVAGLAAAPVDFSIKLSPNTAEVQDAVKASLTDLFRREAEPGGTIPQSHLDEAISIAPGEYDHLIVSPTGPLTTAAGQLAVLGVVTFVAL